MRRDKLRVAVAGGCGDWGRRYTHAYAHHPGAELIALVDTARARRERFAQHYAVPHQFDTVEELLAWQVPDVVANILPVSAARDAVIACAQAGVRGISCEKPIAARLADADAMVAACAENGAAFACGTAWWEVHNIARVGDWVRDGAIGRITGAAIDGFLAHGDQVSGLGCICLNYLRFATGDEVEWVKGWTVPEEAAAGDGDCAAYGVLGMSGGYECTAARELPATGAYQLALFGEQGAVYLAGAAGTVLLQGSGAHARPVRPAFLDQPSADERAGGSILSRGRQPDGRGSGSAPRTVQRPRFPAGAGDRGGAETVGPARPPAGSPAACGPLGARGADTLPLARRRRHRLGGDQSAGANALRFAPVRPRRPPSRAAGLRRSTRAGEG